MMSKPVKQHEWLQRMVGQWAYEMVVDMEPGKPPEKFTGTEFVRSVGPFWVVAEGSGKMPDGSDATTMLTLGFDTKKQRFVGTWYGSMADYLWVYDGSLDEATDTLTLDTEGPSHGTPDAKMTSFRETITLTPDGGRTFKSAMLGADGNWVTLVSGQYRRTK